MLGRAKGPQRLFVSLGRNIPLFEETIAASIDKFHPSYNPLIDDDPLLAYGVEDGLLPGKTAEETIKFRDVIMRWTLPHRIWGWENIEEGIADLKEVKPSKKELFAFGTKEETVYSLGEFHLEFLGHLTLAVTQVLEGIYEFQNKPFRQCFFVDPNWQLLRLMEENLSRTEILVSLASLLHRLKQALKHVDRQLNAIKRVYGKPGLDVLSSVDSTLSSVRSDYGREEPQVELSKLLCRPDY
ncbi:hypothetical protein C8J57DRAFT_1084912, partial [Mycena rebaudengoi]